MSILNITNLTDTPETWIENKYDEAFNRLEHETGQVVSDTERMSFVDNAINNLVDIMENSMGSELLSIIDNFLVNHDYYEDIIENFNK